MNKLFDILLQKPLSQEWLRGLLFASFTLHMVFVLVTLGTAVLSVSWFLYRHGGSGPGATDMDKRMLRSLMAHKSLAVVLGVAPLLLIQVAYTVPFFTAVNLFAPFWMLLVLFLSVAFLAFDGLEHAGTTRPVLGAAAGTLALTSLLAVPAVFVAVLTAAENPASWASIAAHGFRLNGPLARYALFRYLHILGAAIVVAAAFHYHFSTKRETEKRALLKWMGGGLLLQVILGAILFAVLPDAGMLPAAIALCVGAAATAAVLWMVVQAAGGNSSFPVRTTVPLLMLVLVPMLLARQFVQDRGLLPLEAKLEANARAYQAALQTYQATPAAYRSDIHTVYDNGQTIYGKSCAFCHGERGNGDGPEAGSMAVPPEVLSAVRTTRAGLQSLLIRGVHGSAMPYFTVFDRAKLDSLIDYLDRTDHILGMPGPVPVRIPGSAFEQARKTYAQTCSTCHGADGKGSPLSAGFQPAPPDLTEYSLTPERAFEVISKGYPGTAMASFGFLPEDVRWGLVNLISDKRIR